MLMYICTWTIHDVTVEIQFGQPDSMWLHVEQAELIQAGSVCGYREDTNTAFRWLTTTRTWDIDPRGSENPEKKHFLFIPDEWGK